MAKNNNVVLVKGTSAFRKHLRSQARAGLVAIHYHSNKAAGFPVVVGQHVLSNGHATALDAIAWCQHKLNHTPARIIGVKIAA